ncbi:MAG: DUF3883 domain-containing protein, partial [Gammaproteobacteria bacterium]
GTEIRLPWVAGVARRIKKGDYVLISRISREPKGIFACGEVTRSAFTAPHVAVQDNTDPRSAQFVEVRFTAMADGQRDVLIPRFRLNVRGLAAFRWDVKRSGERLPDTVVDALIDKYGETLGLPSPEPEAAEAASLPPEPAPKQPPPAEPSQAAAQSGDGMRSQERSTPLEPARGSVQAAPPTPPFEALLTHDYLSLLLEDVERGEADAAAFLQRLRERFSERNPDDLRLAAREVSTILCEMGLPFLASFPPVAGHSPTLARAVEGFVGTNPDWVDRLWLPFDSASADLPDRLVDPKAVHQPAPEREKGQDVWTPRRSEASGGYADFVLREASDWGLQAAGVRFALAFESARLRDLGAADRAEAIEVASGVGQAGLGYDLKVPEPGGGHRLISVKTTSYGARFPFLVSTAELACSHSNREAFHLYRVYDFARSPRLFILQGPLGDTLLMEQALIRARV